MIEDNFKHMRDRETHDTTNKNHIPISYWSFAREMGAIESHKRAQVQSSEQTVLPERKIRKDLFDVQDHETSLPNTHAITERATWPTFSPQSSLHIYMQDWYFCECWTQNQLGMLPRECGRGACSSKEPS